MSKEKKKIEYSIHHILPVSRLGSNETENLEMLRDTTHRALHTLFQNQIIAEQLITTVNLSGEALRDDVKQWLIETLNSRDICNPAEWYKEECLKY